MQNSAAALENSFVVSYKVKDKFAIWSSRSTLMFLSKKMKTFVHTDLHTNVLSGIILNSQKLETTYMSSKQTDRMCYSHIM